MKTKFSFILFFILSIGFAQESGQEKSKLEANNPKAVDMYVVIKESKIRIDSLEILKLITYFTKDEWIKNIRAVKDSKYLNIIGNSPIKEIHIYPKQKYQKRVKWVLEEKKLWNE